jgi:SAM-dependent methyltransferase
MPTATSSRHQREVAETSRRHAWTHEAVTSHDTTPQAQMGKIFGYIKGLHATHLINLGNRLGLFRGLATTPAGMRPEALASALELYPEYVRMWCETACALELLDYDPTAGYRLAPHLDQILGQLDSTFYLGPFAEGHLIMARDYDRYPELLRSGGVHPYQDHDESFLRIIAEATRSLPRMFLDAVLPKLPALQSRLEADATILDVGCGGGYALVAFAERYPNVRCVGIDVEPTSIGMAQDLIRSRGLEGRIRVHQVDRDTWPEEFANTFDLITTFLVLHEIRPELKAAVMAQCAQALRPGGQLLLFDERYPSGPSELRDALQIFSVMAQWYEMTWGNILNTRDEIHALLTQHDLHVVDETALSRFYIVTAEKR